MSDDRDEALERALRFVNLMQMHSKGEIHEQAATIYALIEELVAQGVIDLRSLEERRERTRAREAERAQSEVHVQLDADVDKYQLRDLPEIDCEALIPICHARCCKLAFPLTRQDLDERVVHWDYGRPYQIRKRDDGNCVHNDPKTHGCTVYAQRPAICRTYDCRNDKRIWLDFEKRIPAEPG